MCFSAWLCFVVARDSFIDRIDHTLELTHTTLHTRTLTNKVLFRGWLKIIKGSASLQTDVGVRPIWTRAVTSKAKDGWCVVGWWCTFANRALHLVCVYMLSCANNIALRRSKRMYVGIKSTEKFQAATSLIWTVPIHSRFAHTAKNLGITGSLRCILLCPTSPISWRR